MSTTRITDLRADPDADLSEVVEHLRRGGVVAYPTETLYGLGCACTSEGLRRMGRVKVRAPGKPLIALVESVGAVEGLRWTDAARELAAIFWPGAVTLVLEDPDGIFPAGIRSDTTVGVRVSSHPVPTRLVSELGGALTSTSVNAPGEIPISSGRGVCDLLERLDATDVWVLDGGTLPPSRPSTVVDCTKREPVVLREGTVPIDRLRCAIPEIHGHISE